MICASSRTITTNIQSQPIFGTELIEFCDMNNLCFTDGMMLLHLLAKPMSLHLG